MNEYNCYMQCYKPLKVLPDFAVIIYKHHQTQRCLTTKPGVISDSSLSPNLSFSYYMLFIFKYHFGFGFLKLNACK